MECATGAGGDLGAKMGAKTIREGATERMGVAKRFLRAQRRAVGTGERLRFACEKDGAARTLECS